VILDFHCDVDENRGRLVHYAASSANF